MSRQKNHCALIGPGKVGTDLLAKPRGLKLA